MHFHNCKSLGDEKAPIYTYIAVITTVKLLMFYWRIPPSNAVELKETFPMSLMGKMLNKIFLSEKCLLLNPFKCVLIPKQQVGNCSQGPYIA